MLQINCKSSLLIFVAVIPISSFS